MAGSRWRRQWPNPRRWRRQTSEKWPTNTGYFPVSPLEFSYGSGWYLSLVKIVIFWLVFLLWVKTADWVNQDAQRRKNRAPLWNQIMFGPFIAAVIIAWLVPSFWLGLPIMAAALVLPLGVVCARSELQAAAARARFLRAASRYWAAGRLRPLGIKIAVEAKKKNEPMVTLRAQGVRERPRRHGQPNEGQAVVRLCLLR